MPFEMRRTGFFAALIVLAGLLIGLLAGLSACGTEEPADEEPAAMQRPAAADALGAEEGVPPEQTLRSGQSVAERLEDASLAARLKKALVEERALRTYNFDIDVTDGRVTLRGDVRTRAQYELAAQVAQDVEGARSVRNEVLVAGEPVLAGGTPTDAEQQQESPRSETAGAEYHTVRSGESLWTIARESGTSVARLRELNDLTSSSLQPGDRLRVR